MKCKGTQSHRKQRYLHISYIDSEISFNVLRVLHISEVLLSRSMRDRLLLLVLLVRPIQPLTHQVIYLHGL